MAQTGSLVKTGDIEGVLVGIDGAWGFVLTYRDAIGGFPVHVFTVQLNKIQVIDPANQFQA